MNSHLVGHVAPEGLGGATRFIYGGNCFGSGIFILFSNRYFGTFGSEAFGDGLADSLSASGYDGYLAL